MSLFSYVKNTAKKALEVVSVATSNPVTLVTKGFEQAKNNFYSATPTQNIVKTVTNTALAAVTVVGGGAVFL